MEKLAIEGGRPACPPGTIPPWPIFDHREEEGLSRVLRSRVWWRVPGKEVDAFEAEFAAFHDARRALAVTNGTQAIELSLAALGVGRGDEVIVPAFTFASTATAVLAVGALAVPVDVDPDTYCIDLRAVRRAITPRTRAILPVHLAGHPCDMQALSEIAAQHDLHLIGDAAHAHGVRWAGESITRLAKISIFSFQSGKLMTAGEGGAVVYDDESLAERLWVLHSCGRPRADRSYRHVATGTNLRVTELQGAILRAQLARLPDQLAEREEAAPRLDALLGSIGGLRMAKRDPRVSRHGHYMYMIELDELRSDIDRDALVDALVAEGVPAFRSYMAIPDFPAFAEGSGSPEVREAMNRQPVPVSRRFAARSLWLHHAVLLGGAEVQRSVAAAFDKVLRRMGRASKTAR
ncbi:hypothetical protein SOCEGT47_074550 [Sorangium cellulosum]|uniref:DegT/DnrJ/EryC1/StrS family aminotransferase n=1 Tax=Sorangium cellulosum TaxID=56 RepID=A0A4P2QB69_SORCE|nr:DegT/DnrJ/EryC1/StrS family aminotransferase [Sorangium cellulosum]AUX26885.1 hypothetical protein SOCEGT47_074550 [Sorangium cellulosum]